ncbi:uncharacterized protein AB675_424 [Cyphellophora attinorum]|uniref:Uncharacterized protein n=1 Tax=Cyphellophora attinorum TaxID=1664694 RepID=A0A0N0NS41_9EURO|nr:uncharacterized protein AB675_424 [Phialophora attinorum]KPI45818.1 hypothetical protein AB675_424 [Phialophora attinorum]
MEQVRPEEGAKVEEARVHDCRATLPTRLNLSANIINISTSDHQGGLPSSIERVFKAGFAAYIYNSIAHPRDQIALTLTCRAIARAIATDKSLTLASGTTHVHNNTRQYVYGKEHLLYDLKKWHLIPGGLQLCSACWKYLPRDRIWKTKDGKRQLRELRMVDWTWAIMMWKEEVRHVKNWTRTCPTCAIPDEWWASDNGEDHGEDDGEARFCQAWGEGVAERVMVVQKYKKRKREADDVE